MIELRRLAMVASILLAACGGQDSETAETDADYSDTAPTAQNTPAAGAPSAPAGGAAGPCSYISDADISRIVGHQMRLNQTGQSAECTYVSATGDVNIAVAYQVVPSPAIYQQMASAGEALPGIGENAVVIAQGASSMVAALDGGRSYLGSVYNVNQQTAVRQQSIDLARAVVSAM